MKASSVPTWTPPHPNIESIKPAFETMQWGKRYYSVKLKDPREWKATLEALKRRRGVIAVEPDYELSDPSVALPADPSVEKQWYLSPLKIPEAWEISTGKNVWIADVESGFDTDHPDLKNQFDLGKSRDYDPDTDDVAKVNDNQRRHGTPVCGVLAAQANNDIGGAGVAYDARLIGSQLANSLATHVREEAWTVNAAKAILGSVERGASVILIEKQVPSLFASVERVGVIREAIAAAVAAGVPVIVPAGNFGRELKEEAELPDTGSIMVGATTKEHEPLSYSNYGDRVDVTAPGESVYSTQEDGGEILDFGGTSSAAAIVAGAVALVKSANPALRPKEIRKLLKETAAAGKLVQVGPAVQKAVHKQ